MEKIKRAKWLITTLSLCFTLAYTPALAPGDIPPELHLETIKLPPLASIVSSVQHTGNHDNFYSGNVTIGGTNNHSENNIVEKGTNNVSIGNTHFAGSNNNITNNVHKQGSNNIYIGNTTVSSSNNDIHDTYSEGSDNNVVINNNNNIPYIADVENSSKVSEHSYTDSPSADTKKHVEDDTPKISDRSYGYSTHKKSTKSPYLYQDDRDGSVWIFILIAAALFTIVHFRLQDFLLFVFLLPFKIARWFIHCLYDFFNEDSGAEKKDETWLAEITANQKRQLDAEANNPDRQQKSSPPAQKTSSPVPKPSRSVTQPSPPVQGHLNFTYNDIDVTYKNTNVTDTVSTPIKTTLPDTVPTPIKIPQPVSKEKFCKVRFPGRSKKTYDYFIGDVKDIEVGDIVEVFVHDRLTKTISKKLATVTYLSQDGEVSYYARSTIIKIHHKFYKLLR